MKIYSSRRFISSAMRLFGLHPVNLPALILVLAFTGVLIPLHAETPCAAEQPAGEISIHCAQAPGSTLDQDGRLWAAFAQDRHLYVSRNAGDRWLMPVRVTAAPEAIEVNGENRPKIIVRDEHIFLSWTTKTEGNHTGNIRFSRSVNGGQNFSEPITINDDGLLTSHRFDSMLLTPAGHLYLVWLDKRNLEAAVAAGGEYAGSAVFGAVSINDGASFSRNFLIADHSCECCRIAVAPHGEENLALVWRQLYEGARDHALAVVTPEGEVLYQSRASVDDWQINACPHHGPAMALAASADEPGAAAYHVSWFSNSEQQKGVYYGRHQLLTGETTDVYQVDGSAGAGHPQLAVRGGITYLLWKQFNGQETVIKLITSTDNGSTWSEAQIIARTALASDHPQLLADKDGLHLAWQTAEEGYRFMSITDPVRAFDAESFSQIKQSYSGRAFIVALWSVDCPPCLAELDLLGRLKAEVPDLPLVLISTDSIESREEAMDYLLDYDLAHMRSWMFADRFVERLRYTIDPQWYGELPRSYFYDADHQAHAHSGVMTETMVQEWLSAQALP